MVSGGQAPGKAGRFRRGASRRPVIRVSFRPVMAQPSFHRSGRSVRKARLRRTVLLAILGLGAAAFLVGRLTGGGEPEKPIAKVAFETSIRGEGAPKPEKGAPETEAKAIEAMFNDFYQRAFVDPDSFSDERYPEVADHFQASARTAFEKDLATLTIGDAATEVERVDPTTATARIIVFFDEGKATLASVGIRFRADATMKTEGPGLRINQRATFHLVREGDAWRIAYYEDASQTQTSIEPTPSGSPS